MPHVRDGLQGFARAIRGVLRPTGYGREFGLWSSVRSLPLEYEEVTRLVQTLGEQSVRDAYFKDDAREIRKLMAAVDKHKVTNPDLLIP